MSAAPAPVPTGLAEPVLPEPAGVRPVPPGVTVWLTGRPSAGKSTLAAGLAQALRNRGRAVEVLDGDEVRTHLSAGLGFSRADRDVNVARIGFVAQLLARHGVVAITAAISPYAAARAQVRQLHEQAGVAFLEVFVATAAAECARRDVKGLYARQAAGELAGLTGVDDPYEEPTAPEVLLVTEGHSVGASVTELVEALAGRGLL